MQHAAPPAREESGTLSLSLPCEILIAPYAFQKRPLGSEPQTLSLLFLLIHIQGRALREGDAVGGVEGFQVNLPQGYKAATFFNSLVMARLIRTLIVYTQDEIILNRRSKISTKSSGSLRWQTLGFLLSLLQLLQCCSSKMDNGIVKN